MTEIYIVTDGDYSDYSIEAVFSTRTQAEAYIAVAGGRIEQYELDAEGSDGLFWFRVDMEKNGDSDVEHRNYDHIPDDKLRFVEFGGFLDPRPRRYVLYVYVKARDKLHAVKIANEKRAQIIAADEWPEIE